MNHLGDTNKMVSETPRTDKEAFFPPEAKYNICDADFARTLERELNAAQQRIKRLEEALSKIELAMKQPASNPRFMQIAGPARQALNIINRAKEAKP